MWQCVIRMSDSIDIEYLIELVSQNPCIWDKTDEGYHSRTVTNGAWRNVCGELNDQFEELTDKQKDIYEKSVLKKWRNIRDQWLKSTKKLLDSKKKPGGGASRTKPYIHNDQLSFLKKTAGFTEEFSFKDDLLETRISVADTGKSDHNTAVETSRRKTKASTAVEDEVVRKLVKTEVEKPTLHPATDEDPKVMFFKGILPHMADFTDDEDLQFQSDVLHLIQKIRRERLNEMKYSGN